MWCLPVSAIIDEGVHTHPRPREPGTPRLYLREPVAGKDRAGVVLKPLLHQIRDDLVKRSVGSREAPISPCMSFVMQG